MRHFLGHCLRHHPIVTGALALVLAAALFLLTHVAADALYFADPRNQNRPLEMWMSPRFVGQSWDLPRPVIFGIMQIERGDEVPGNGPRTLRDVTARTGLSLADLQAALEAAQTEIRSRNGR